MASTVINLSSRLPISNSKFNTIVLAAGFGTRFKPHTEILPKPVFPFLNNPFLFYSTHLAEYLITTKLVINTHHLPTKIKELVIRIVPPTCASIKSARYYFLDEDPIILGSAGGIKNAEGHLKGNGNFLTLNADSAFWPSDFNFFRNLQSKHMQEGALATLALIEHPGVGTLYNAVWINAIGEVVGMGKQPPLGVKVQKGLHFTGMQWLSDDVFDLIPYGKACDIFRDILLPQIAQGKKVLGHEVKGHWFEAGSLEIYLADTKRALDLLNNQDPRSLLNFNSNDYVHSIFSRLWRNFEKREYILEKVSGAQVLRGHDSTIDPTAELSGFVILGEGVNVPAGCALHNTVINSGVVLPADFAAVDSLVLATP
ncbi:MAG: sugar phosphate nucleotidyltransferase [Pseudomonadota bacterium]|nr:sugar phosphate nucleotidyltransferase [Pseudomonadota bacterium]